jgi:hypothetical protein
MEIGKELFMDNQQQYMLTFENALVADANRWASELKEFILDATDEVEVEQERDTPPNRNTVFCYCAATIDHRV